MDITITLPVEQLRALIREELRHERAGRSVVMHSQRDGERPAGAGRIRYLRAWRALRDAGDPDVRREGRARLMSQSSWARFVAGEKGEKPAPAARPRLVAVPRPSPVDVEARVLADLGARAAPRAGRAALPRRRTIVGATD